MVGAFVDFVRGAQRWQVSYKLGMQDIELRYRRSLLGPFWISASLVATILTLSYVFSSIFRQEYTEYVAFLGAGMLVWGLLQTLVTEGCGAMVEHGALLQNVQMPQSAIAARIIVRNAVIFVHNLLAVLVTLIILGAHPEPSAALMAIPGTLLILLTGFFVVLVLGPISARFRDVPQVMTSIMQVMFFLTPIIWLPDQASHRPMITEGNPFFHMIELVRAPLLGGEASTHNWIVGGAICGGMAILALLTIQFTRTRVVLWL